MKRSLLTILLLIATNAYYANVLTVTNNNDSGSGSLRAQIAAANTGDTIAFDNSIQGQAILLTSGEISFSKRIMIQGNGVNNTILDGGQNSRIFNISGIDSVIINNLTIQNGSATSDGGAILCENVEKVYLNSILFENNSSAQSGGAISTFSFAFPIRLYVDNCTFANNTATADGGGIHISNPNQNVYTYIKNSTMTGNSGGTGGAIRSNSNTSGWTSNVIVENSTIVNNTSSTDGGGIYSSGTNSNVEIRSSILVSNGTSNIYSYPGYNITSHGYNILDNTSITGSIATDQMGVTANDVDLGPLQNNGGTISTMAPGCGSIAIDMGDPSDLSDAQNYSIQGTQRDVGAAEGVSNTEINISECFTYTVPSGDETYNTVGNMIVTDTLQSTCSTDSILTIDLTILGNSTHTVMNSDDSGAGSLRQVIDDACSGDTIIFDPSTDGTPINLTTGHFIIAEDLTIIGNGIENTIIDGDSTFRAFYIYNSSNVKIQALAIQNGYTSGSNGAGIAADDATIALENIKITSCYTGDNTLGGALYLGSSNTTIDNSIFSGNYAKGSGGAIYQIYNGSLEINNSIITGNVTDDNGGGIYSPSPSQIELNNVTITGNYAANQFGGIMDSFTANNTIIWGNDAANGNPETAISNASLNYSIVKNESGISGNGNLDGTTANDPLFLQAITPSSTPNSSGDFRIGKFSTLVDAGDNNSSAHPVDLAGNNRIEDGDGNGTATIDLGAFENPSTLNLSTSTKVQTSIYPNPTQQNITISSDNQIHEVEILNTLGASVVNILPTSTVIKINVNHLNTGVYFVKIKNQNGSYSTHKLVKK
ncbi:T9SS type A sorting domain-containing protein [Brumimicrobium aurantiacum]|uniref:T9SS C-terminal target domain-containing protein n=1 Tax=Brumimicrobium aurantiacum TaxID=1737063 RepID=A0A3E1EYV5_9FLAO|nr:T9SS type A sorting domain-containing protein [Brumimicrobium aurantiacum]RFC54728.1 T9SS C-terminal target domain-containing protein [Brumimicrobium aurantiacum]